MQAKSERRSILTIYFLRERKFKTLSVVLEVHLQQYIEGPTMFEAKKLSTSAKNRFVGFPVP